MNSLFKLTLGALAIGFSGLGMAQATTGSFRQDLQITKTLVGMSAARAVQIEGLKASYAYSFTMTDMNRKFPGQSNYNLVLGAADGRSVNMFTLSYKGPAAEPGFSTFGQVIGHLSRHCLGVSEELLRSIGADFAKEIEASASQGGAVRSVSKQYGSVILVGQNIQITNSSFSFVFYLSNTAKVGAGNWKTTCIAKI